MARRKKRRNHTVESDRKRKEKKELGVKSSVLAIILGIVIIFGVILAVRSMNFNIPPSQPYVKYPTDGQKRVPRNLKLEWGCEDPDGDRLSYDLYVGEGTPTLVATSLTFPVYELKLLPGKEYKWLVVARDGKGGVSRSPVWRFETAPNSPPNPPKAISPSQGETVDSSKVALNWTDSDPDGDEVFYDLYVDGIEVAKDLKVPSYTVSAVEGEKHLWRVVAKDKFGGRSESEWWFYVRKPNRPPRVSLTAVKVGDGWIEVWWKATDPDGDPIKSDLFLDGRSVKATPGKMIKTVYGRHKLEVVVSDGVSETRVSTEVVVKKPLPPEKPRIIGARRTISGIYHVKWEATDPDSTSLSYEIFLDGKKLEVTRSKELNLKLPPGDHKIKVVAVDEGGRKNESEMLVKVLSPDLNLFVPDVVYSSSVNVKWNFPTEAVYSLYVDEKRMYSGRSKSVSLNLTPGEHKLRLVAHAFGKSFVVEKSVTYEKPYDVLALSEGEGLFLVNVSKKMKIVDDMGGIDGSKMDYSNKIAAVVGRTGEVYVISVEDSYMALLSILNESALDVAVGKDYVYILSGEKILKVDFNGSVINERNLSGGTSLDFDGKLFVGMDGRVMELDPDLTVLRSWNVKGKVRKVFRDGRRIVVVENWGIEVIGGGSISLPDPRDAVKTKNGYAVADQTLGVVFLNSDLQVTGSVDVPGADSISVHGDELVAFGRGIYRIREGEVVEKLGRGEKVLSTCDKFVATDRGLYFGVEKLFDGEVSKVRCSGKKAAFSSYGKLFLYDGKVYEEGIPVSDFGMWNGKVYAVSNGKLLVVEEGRVGYVAKASAFGDGYYAYGKEVHGLDGEEFNVSEEVLDISARGKVVAILERSKVEVFENGRRVAEIPGVYQGIEVGDGRIFTYRSGAVYAFDLLGKELWEMPVGNTVHDLAYAENKVNVSSEKGGLVILDPRNGSVIYDEPVLICGGGK